MGADDRAWRRKLNPVRRRFKAAGAFVLNSRPGVLAGMALTVVGALGQIGYVLDGLDRRSLRAPGHP